MGPKSRGHFAEGSGHGRLRPCESPSKISGGACTVWSAFFEELSSLRGIARAKDHRRRRFRERDLGELLDPRSVAVRSLGLSICMRWKDGHGYFRFIGMAVCSVAGFSCWDLRRAMET